MLDFVQWPVACLKGQYMDRVLVAVCDFVLFVLSGEIVDDHLFEVVEVAVE